jgi:hypothetical protein
MSDMPKQVFDALKVILNEFGDCDLEPRLEYFAGYDDDSDERECGRQLLRAFSLVQAWSNNPALTEGDIRASLEESDSDWHEYWEARVQEESANV